MSIKTGEEILEMIRKIYICTLDEDVAIYPDIQKALEDKVVVSASRWAEIKEHVKKLKDNPTCDLSFKPLGYQVSLKDMDELVRLLEESG